MEGLRVKITRESIAEKLGFDPMDPPEWNGDMYSVDDAVPSIWAPLNKEELAFVFKLHTGRDIKEVTGNIDDL